VIKLYVYLSGLVFISFITSCEREDLPGAFTDSRDGHIYSYVKIGGQTWMTENLAYLPEVGLTSTGLTTVYRYYVYGYTGDSVEEAKESSNYSTYGVLYNWVSAKDACLPGWHLPGDEEWMVLEKYLGMSESETNLDAWRGSGVVGAKLKEAGTNHWLSPQPDATNSSRFTAFPGGYYHRLHGFSNLGDFAGFWSATGTHIGHFFRSLRSYDNGMGRGHWWDDFAFSVRCIKDE
jgi:uncharacterized protein (TIGR02145 family)